MRAQFVFEFAKKPHGKFYASQELVKKIIDETFKIVDINSVSEIIEPATGGGAFIPQLDAISQQYRIPVTYMDKFVDPSVRDRVIPQDFLDYIPEGDYFDPNRLIITGPPYGDREEDQASTKLGRKFGTKAAEIAGHISFIAPVSWLIDNYPAKGLKIIRSFNLDNQKFSGQFNVRTAIVICESMDPQQWKVEKEKDEDFGRLEKHFKIRKWEKKRGDSPNGWDYFINFWGKYNSGEVVKMKPNNTSMPISRTGTPLSAALAIKITNQNPILIAKFENWIKDFEKIYKPQIEKLSLNTDNTVPLKLFKRFLRDYLYPKH